ncbi:MAG: EamA family transporter [Candidatus Palauibacterales bacterium]|nr:EamA family transporter [Candidatus Palauibacterales bacterium]
MTWLLLAAGAATFYALQGAWTKRITAEVSRLSATWALFAFSFPLLGGYLALRGVPAVEPAFWPALAANLFVLYPLSMYLFVSAMTKGDLGLTYPLLALTPIMIVPVEWLLLGDTPELQGLAGIVLVIAGVYLLNFRREDASLLAPFLAVARDPGARRGLAVAVLWAVGGTVDRVAVVHSSPAFYGTVITGGLTLLGLVPLAWTGAFRRPGRSAAGGDQPSGDGDPGGSDEGSLSLLTPRAAGFLLVQGLLNGLMFVCQMEALRLSLAAYVITIKRTGTLLSVLLGWAFFQEGLVRKRLAGAAVIVAGVALVALGG